MSFLSNINTILIFFSQTRSRKCLKLEYDFKTLLLSAEIYLEISERVGSFSTGSEYKE
jgi:hypothetical protein